MTLNDLTTKIKNELKVYYSQNEIWIFIKLIFNKLLNLEPVQIHTYPDLQIPVQIEEDIKKIIRNLKNYKPIQYILGETEFFGLKFRVTPDVLIPRPETEELVSLVIDENKQARNLNIIDIGTGSGCIIVSLAKYLEGNNFYATDIKKEALKVAKLNAEIHEVKVNFQLHDIIATYPVVFSGNIPKYDIIVSNPPYVLPSTKPKMSKTVLDYEPETALFVPENEPLIYYEALCFFARQFAKPNAKIYCEINEFLHKELVQMLNNKGFTNFSMILDLNDKKRILKVNI